MVYDNTARLRISGLEVGAEIGIKEKGGLVRKAAIISIPITGIVETGTIINGDLVISGYNLSREPKDRDGFTEVTRLSTQIYSKSDPDYGVQNKIFQEAIA